MAKNDIEFKIGADTNTAISNVQRFEREFKKLLETMGKDAGEIKAFKSLARDIEKGVKSTDDLDAETRQLIDTYQSLRKQAQDRDFLGLNSHDVVRNRVEALKDAYDRLKASGSLSSRELAQASLNLNRKIRDLEQSTNGWLDALGSAKAELAAMAGSAAAIGGLVNEAVQFESAMAGVRKVVAASDAEFSQLAERIKDLAQAGTLSANELAKIAAVGGQLGVPIAKLGQFTELASRMATAFDIGAEASAQAIAKLANVFDLPIENVEALSDAINTLGNNTAASEEQILDALIRIGGTSRQFGLAADQAAALADAFIALGKPPEVAATAINAMLVRLQTATTQGRQFQQALDDMGLSAQQLAADINRDPQRALSDFLTTLQQLDNQSRAEILTRLFGQEHQDEISALVASLGNYEQALNLVNDRSAVAGATTREFDARMQSTGAQMERLANAVEVLAINLGSTLLPVINPMVEALGGMTGAIAKLASDFPGLARAATVLSTVAISAQGAKVAFLALRLAGSSMAEDLTAGFGAVNQSVAGAVQQIGRLKTAFSLLATAVTGFEIGTALKDQFLEVEQAGIALAAGLTKVGERLRFIGEVATTPIDGKFLDNVSDAYDRLQQRLAVIDDQYADLFIQAERNRGQQQTLAQQTDQLADSFARLGLDAQRAATGIGSDFDQAAADFSRITAAVDQGNSAIATAVDHLIAHAQTTQETARVQELLNQAQQAGKLSSEQYQVALERLNQSVRDNTDQASSMAISAEQLSESYRQLGVDVQQATTGISGSFANLAGAFATVVKGSDSYNQALALAAANLVKNAKSSQELQTALALVDAAQQAGKLSTEQAAAAHQAAAQGALAEAAAVQQLNQERQAAQALEESTAQFRSEANAAKRHNAELAAEIQRKEAQAAEEKRQAIERERQAAEGFAQAFNNLLRSQHAEIEALGQGASDLLARLDPIYRVMRQGSDDARRGLTDIQAGLAASADEARRLRENAAVAFGNDLLTIIHETAVRVNNVKRAYFEQRQEVENLTRRLSGADSVTQQMIANAERAARNFSLMNEADLQPLRDQIERAKNKLQEMQDQANRARDSLSDLGRSLRDELDRIAGNQQAIEERRFQDQLRRIQELEQASFGAAKREAENARRLAQQVHNERLRQLQTENRARQSRAPANTRLDVNAGGGVARQVTKVVQLKLGRNSVDIPANQEQDLLSMLEQFKRVT